MTDAGNNIDVQGLELEVLELKAILKRKSIPYTDERQEELISLYEKADQE